MNNKLRVDRATVLAAVAALLVCTPEPAWAYAGPGSGLTVIGAAVAFIGALVLAVVGFVWYPIKRLLRRKAKQDENASTPADIARR